MTASGSYQVFPCLTKLYQVVPSRTKSYQVVPSRTKSYQVVPSHSKLYQVLPSLTESYQVSLTLTKSYLKSQYARPCPVLSASLVPNVGMHCSQALSAILVRKPWPQALAASQVSLTLTKPHLLSQ